MPVNTGILQRKCGGCGNHTIAGEKCGGCENKNMMLQKKAVNQAASMDAPPIVSEVLRSSGRPLDGDTRSFFESRFAGEFSRVPVNSPARQASPGGLTVGGPNDAFEREADRAADSIMRNGNEQRNTPARGFDLSGVRVHTDPRAAESARAVNAQAYTVGSDIVFGAGQFEPKTQSGRRLIAHELAHVAQQAGPNVVRRDLVKDAAGAFVSYEFRFGAGHELTEGFAKKAKSLTADGTLSNADILTLKKEANTARDTVSDHERMFMAGLLDAANVAALRATTISATTSVTFPLSTITAARIRQVIEAGQPTMPASVSTPAGKGVAATLTGDLKKASVQFGKAERAIEKEIRRLAGSGFRWQIGSVIAFAQANGVLLLEVLNAMLKGASDNTPADRMMAAAAYATAAAAGHTLAADISAGAVRMDALVPARFALLPGMKPGIRALYIAAAPMNPTFAGLKGDTIYMPTDFDIDNLSDRSNIIHELRHTQDDKAASTTAQPVFPAQQGLEVAAYKAQARYILDQMAAQTGAAQIRSVTEVAGGGGSLVLLAMLIDAQRDLPKFSPLVVQVFGAASPPLHVGAVRVTRMLATPVARLEALLEAEIRTGYGITATSPAILEGQAGESLVHWIHRL
jgi:hypothetical protein